MTARAHRGKVDTRWRAEQRRNHVRDVGLICSGIKELEILPHNVGAITDLQVDHIKPLHAGGSEYGPHRIVCKACNEAYRVYTYSSVPKKELAHPPVEVPFSHNPLLSL